MHTLAWLLRAVGFITVAVAILYLQTTATFFLWHNFSWHTIFLLRWDMLRVHWRWCLALITGLVAIWASHTFNDDVIQENGENVL
jgi:hypothetical protein